MGRYKSEEYYTSGGFQDFTDYAKYTFENVDFSNNEYFSKISSDSVEELTYHIEDFEKRIETIKNSDPKNEVVLGYNYDSSVVSENDYLYIYDDPDYPDLGCYDVYFFDIETMMLYYLQVSECVSRGLIQNILRMCFCKPFCLLQMLLRFPSVRASPIRKVFSRPAFSSR